MIDVFRDIGRSHGAFVERHTPPDGMRMELLQEAGHGWFDACRLGNSGMTLGRACYRPLGEAVMACRDDEDCVGFSLLLSGQMAVSLADISFQGRIAPGELWLRRGRCGQYRSLARGGRLHRGVSVDLPRALMNDWLAQSDSIPDRLKDALLDPEPAWLQLQVADAAPLHAERLLSLDCGSLVGRLQAESLVLDWLARLLGALATTSHSPPRPRWCGRIDEAVEILRAECMNPPGILDLARRVGVNECYLKRGVRERTGHGVAAYARMLRMQKASELLRGGLSVQQVSAQLGYLNPSQFAKAFRQHFGTLPSVYGRAG